MTPKTNNFDVYMCTGHKVTRIFESGFVKYEKSQYPTFKSTFTRNMHSLVTKPLNNPSPTHRGVKISILSEIGCNTQFRHSKNEFYGGFPPK